MSFTADMDSDIDKTGFDGMKSRALKKAWAIGMIYPSGDVSIGPNATSFETSSMRTPTLSTPKTHSSEKRLKSTQTENSFLNSPNMSEEDFLCTKQILCQLDRLAINEAQEAKFAFLKKIDDHIRKRDEEVAQFIAKEEAVWLKIEQQRMERLAAENRKITFSADKENVPPTQNFNSPQALSNTTKEVEEQQQRLEEIKLRNLRFDQIFKNRGEFMTLYNLFLEKISHEDLNAIRASEMSRAKTTNETFSSLLDECKNGSVSQEDVEKSILLVNVLADLCERADKELVKQEELKRKKKEEEEREEKRLKEEKERQEKELAAKKENSDYTKLYESVHKYYKEVESQLKDFVVDDSLKKFRSDCQKAVNIPVNAISPLDAKHLNDKLNRLVALLKGQTVTVSDKRITAGTHPLGVLYAKNFLASKIVKQGEHVVSSKPEASFAIASVAIAIWNEFPDFGQLLLAHFYKVCPYLIPKYLEKTSEETDEEYYRKLGFLYSNGEKEEINMFLKRQGGVVRLYAAIIISPQKKANSHLPHPLSIAEAWRWTAAFVFLNPKAFISATLLLDMLDVTGNAMLAAYGNQFKKLLHLICKSYLPEVEKVTPKGSGGPVTRLTSFLEAIVQGKSIAPPKGLLPPDFW